MDQQDSLQFQAIMYSSPPEISICQLHRNANLIFKDTFQINLKSFIRNSCQCCGKVIGRTPKLNVSYDPLQLSIYGPGLPLFFLFFKSIIFLLIVYSLLFGVFAMVVNFKGNNCQQNCGTQTWSNRSSIMNIFNEKQMMIIQKLLLLLIAILTIIQSIVIRKRMRKLETHIDNFLVTPSDFSIFIRLIPQGAVQSDVVDMVKQMSQFLDQDERQDTNGLEIAKIIMVNRLQSYIEREKQNFKLIKKKLKKIKGNNSQHGHVVLSQVIFPQQFARTAIVIFNKQSSKDYFLQKSNICQQLAKYFWFSYHPRSNTHRILDQFVSITRAPDPDDIIWVNCGKSNGFLIRRRLCLYLLSLIILALGGGIQFYLQWYRRQKLPENFQLAFSIFESLIITLVNFIFVQVLVFVVQFEKYDSQTQKNIALTFRIVFFQFLNSGIFQALSSAAVKGSQYKYKDEYITFDIINFMGINAIVQNILTILVIYFQLPKQILRLKLNKWPQEYTQIEANQIYQSPKIQIEFKYAYIFKTFWLTVFFMSTLPIVLIISVSGLLINFWIEKYLCSGKYKEPQKISSYLNNHVMNLFDFTILWMTIGSFLIHYVQAQFKREQIPSEIMIPHYILLIIGLINLFMPHKAIIKRMVKKGEKVKITSSYLQLESQFQLRFEDTNPISMNKKRKKIRQMQQQKMKEMLNQLMFDNESNRQYF